MSSPAFPAAAAAAADAMAPPLEGAGINALAV